MFCVGTDLFHTQQFLTNSVDDALEDLGKDFAADRLVAYLGVVLVDRPYSVTMVPSQFYGLDSRVEFIMIEVNRSLDMDEGTGKMRPCFDNLRASLEEVHDGISESWNSVFREQR